MGVWCVYVHACAHSVFVSVHARMHCVCVCSILPIFYWFIGPHESFTALDEIVCFFHHEQDQKNVGATSTIVVFFTDRGPDCTSLTSGCELWRCAYITAS